VRTGDESSHRAREASSASGFRSGVFASFQRRMARVELCVELATGRLSPLVRYGLADANTQPLPSHRAAERRVEQSADKLIGRRCRGGRPESGSGLRLGPRPCGTIAMAIPVAGPRPTSWRLALFDPGDTLPGLCAVNTRLKIDGRLSLGRIYRPDLLTSWRHFIIGHHPRPASGGLTGVTALLLLLARAIRAAIRQPVVNRAVSRSCWAGFN